MRQPSIFQEKKEKICAFTGHRQLDEDFCAEVLREEIERAYARGYTAFLCGMAVGFDLLAAEFVLSLKYVHPEIQLIAYIPCKEQDKYYSKEDKTRYKTALLCADSEVLVSEMYYRGCMQVRDRYMAERADMLIAYCRKKEGGTAYTVRCFQKAHPEGEIVFV